MKESAKAPSVVVSQLSSCSAGDPRGRSIRLVLGPVPEPVSVLVLEPV